MKRRLVSLSLGVAVLVLGAAAPVSADTGPGINDNGTVSFANAYHEECTRNACTFTAVYLSIDEEADEGWVCVERGTRRSYEYGCAPVAAGDLAITEDAATLSPTIVPLETCNRSGCTIDEVVVSAELEAVGPSASYSRTERYTYPDGCTERFRVRGSSAPAAGTFTIDGDEYAASFGEIGRETYTFSSRCSSGG